MESELAQENAKLRAEVEYYRARLGIVHRPSEMDASLYASGSDEKDGAEDAAQHSLSIIVLGASGDLAKKKTFPSLFSLYGLGLLPPRTNIFGYARSKMTNEEFRENSSKNFSGFEEKKSEFVQKLFYFAGAYDSEAEFREFLKLVASKETKKSNRMYYMAIPPNVFVDSSRMMKGADWESKSGWNRVVIEKPFGRDSESSRVLADQLSEIFSEDQIYRIDHYLGKEMVQSLMALRFANTAFEPLWNHHYISNVTITFKEDIGTQGRGGYFDQFGIIRDVMQNHLTQIFSLVAMEPPVSLTARDIRDEKVKVLRSCKVITEADTVIGQYVADKDGKNPGYLDDKTVPPGSKTPTFAMTVIHIDNGRWHNVPFIFKAGKALSERKTEIRIQFKPSAYNFFHNMPPNELVIRIQPSEAVYMKFNAKVPGMSSELIQTELDLTYKRRGGMDVRLPDAYERLIYDVIRGDHNLFVRADELEAAWDVFTPILHDIDAGKIEPLKYEFGSRGPAEADKLAQTYGFIRNDTYTWHPKM